MSIVNPASLSAEERPVEMRTRSDLVVTTSVYQGERCWIVKDPLAMKYFRLREPEYLVFEQLKGSVSYSQLKQLLDRKFPESVTRLETVQQLVVSLHRNGLLSSPAVGQAYPLKKQRNQELKQKAIGLLSSLVSLKFPGIDPERFLSFLYPKVGWFFSTWFTFVVAVTCLAAALLVLGNLNEFYSRLPDFQSFFAFDNLLFMAVILVFTKTIHELGHGLVCKHFGGECHEIGFMLLVLTPAMYCNTSDSWVLPNRWHRMAIGAAGMYVELFMAAICTFIWWFTVPGWIHYLALNIMFLSSVSTIVFNANPLLRYDGYYILSDFLEIPNLGQKSRMALISKLRTWCLGMDPINSRSLPQRHQVSFAIYSVASFVYRWLVLIMIFWFISEIFEPLGLQVIGYVVIGISLFGMVVVPMFKMVKFFAFPGRLREVKRFNLLCTLAVVAVLVGLFCVVPVPQYVYGSCLLRPQDAQVVRVTEAGVLKRIAVQPGDTVAAGQVLGVLENRDLELDLLALKGDRAKLQHDLTGFELSRSEHLDANRLIVETRREIAAIDKLITARQRQLEPLTLTANRAGVIYSPPNRAPIPTESRELPRWSGTPLDPENQGVLLEPNTEFCLVADPDQFEAMIVVDQADVGLIRSEQTGRIVLDSAPGNPLRFTVSNISQDELTVVDRELSQTNGGPVAVKPAADGQEVPVLTLFEVNAAIVPDEDVALAAGLIGTAKIRVGSASMATITIRYLRNLINFR